ncbi:MAG: copper transporter [Streptosporangiales bacterium]|nr:copper transporter [Streptosporangiales bacterium]
MEHPGRADLPGLPGRAVGRLHLLADRTLLVIDFRYHLVSIVAVFLALAVGIVLGTTMLQDPFLDQLKAEGVSLKEETDKLRADKDALTALSTGDDQLIGAYAPQLVAERLTDARVVVMTAPGADARMVEAVAARIQQAGATVTGTVGFTDRYLEDQEGGVISGLTDRLKPAELALPSGTRYERAAAEIAWATLAKNEEKAGREDPAAEAVLTGFQTGGYLKLSGEPATRATLAVVIAPSSAFPGPDINGDNAAFVAVARALDDTGQGAVVAGGPTARATDGLLAALRDDDAADGVSSNDVADTQAGQVVTVLALAGERKGQSGQYGIGERADAFLPDPVPPPISKG